MIVIDEFSISAVIIAYLLGSISTAILLCKISGLPDPRTKGSKNAGATNMLRIAGKKLAALTLLGDLLKGVVAVMLGRIMGLSGFELGVVALAVFLGHLYPIYFGFKGGKGIATFIGILIVLSPWVAICFVITWLLVAYVFKYSSLAALIATATVPFFVLLFKQTNYLIPLLIIIALIFWRHRENIKALHKGKETKIKSK